MPIAIDRLGWFGGLDCANPRRTFVSAQTATAYIMFTPHFHPTASSTRLLFRQDDQVVAEHALPYAPGKSLKPVKETAKQAKDAFQAGNSPLDSGAECLTTGQQLVHEIGRAH